MKKFSLLFASLLLGLIFNISDVKADKKVDNEEDTYELLNLFGEVMERTKMSYVEEVTDKKLIESALNGMLSSLDPHSSYLDAESFNYMSEQTKGKFGGLGIEVTMENGLVKVVSPIDDTPAAKAGIKAGDYITNIDGETVIGLNLNEAVSKLRGKIGTKVKLSIRRINSKPIELTITRQEIKIQSVKSEIKEDAISYIRISSFTEDIDKNITEAINKAKKQLKSNFLGIVIDVRNNPLNGCIHTFIPVIATNNTEANVRVIGLYIFQANFSNIHRYRLFECISVQIVAFFSFNHEQREVAMCFHWLKLHLKHVAVFRI